MITSKNNFKKYLRTHYPDIKAESISGVSAYLLDRPLSDQDMLEYGVMQLADGKYVVFIGMRYADVIEAFTVMQDRGVTTTSMVSKAGKEMPTTFTAFQQWLYRNDFTSRLKHRTFRPHISIHDCFYGITSYSNNSNVMDNAPNTWYQYEFAGEIEHELLKRVPHAIVENTDHTLSTVVLIKASSSSYKSKKQLRLENFQLMQPLYEQIIAECSAEEWEKATYLCSTYKKIKFQKEQQCNLEELKEAYTRGALSAYLTKEEENYDYSATDMEEGF